MKTYVFALCVFNFVFCEELVNLDHKWGEFKVKKWEICYFEWINSYLLIELQNASLEKVQQNLHWTSWHSKEACLGGQFEENTET